MKNLLSGCLSFFHSCPLILPLKVSPNTVVQVYALIHAVHHLWNNLPRYSLYWYTISVSVHYNCSTIISCLIELFGFPFWVSASSLQPYFKGGKDLETTLISCTEEQYWLFLKPWNQKLQRKTKGWNGKKWNSLFRRALFLCLDIHIYIAIYLIYTDSLLSHHNFFAVIWVVW